MLTRALLGVINALFAVLLHLEGILFLSRALLGVIKALFMLLSSPYFCLLKAFLFLFKAFKDSV